MLKPLHISAFSEPAKHVCGISLFWTIANPSIVIIVTIPNASEMENGRIGHSN